MNECPYCGEPMKPNQASCLNCKTPIMPKYPTPSELAAQTTKMLQRLLAKAPDANPQDKHNPFDTRKHTLLT
jgi:hypothetical protein